jgi:splicing factor 3B subunit 1
MDAEHAFYYTREVMVVLKREFQTPDEEMKKIVLKVGGAFWRLFGRGAAFHLCTLLLASSLPLFQPLARLMQPPPHTQKNHPHPSSQVVKQCVGTEGVEPDYIRTEVLPEFFRCFWQRRMALDRRNYRALVETTVEVANKAGCAEIVGRVVEDLKDESEPYRWVWLVGAVGCFWGGGADSSASATGAAGKATTN